MTRIFWESPLYKFRVPVNEQSVNLKEIFIDVTGSAPPFEEVLDTMKNVFDELLRSQEGKKIESVLDFGAAKLRNSLFFLKKGKKVTAVEFEELFTKSSQAQRILNECKKKAGNFKQLIFPNQFVTNTKKYDLALLVNVLPVMPIFAERLQTLQLLYDKINDNGYLLWYAQHEGSYKKIRESNKQNLGDGVWMGKSNRFKTFFKYHDMNDVNEMMALSGFELIKRFSAPGNDAVLYQKTRYNLFNEVITPKKILSSISFDESMDDPTIKLKKVKKSSSTKKIIPNPSELSMNSLYSDALEKIDPGPDHAEIYHRLISQIVYRIFRGSLRNMELKQETQRGVKIIDTVFSNKSEKGFFHDLQNSYEIKSPFIVLEAKNYSYDPENPEFDQLAGRLNDKIGRFGILACRTVDDPVAVKAKCQGYVDANNYVIVLTDEELLKLLNFTYDEENNEVDDFMDNKMKPLLFRTK